MVQTSIDMELSEVPCANQQNSGCSSMMGRAKDVPSLSKGLQLGAHLR